jgi:hypothetical protein
MGWDWISSGLHTRSLLHGHEPHETITLWINKIQAFFSPYIQITIPDEYSAGHYGRSDFYLAIEAYLSEHCGVRKLKAELGSSRKITLFYVDDGQQIIDTFRGGDGGGSGVVWWYAYKEKPVANVIYRPGEEERRFYPVMEKAEAASKDMEKRGGSRSHIKGIYIILVNMFVRCDEIK